MTKLAITCAMIVTATAAGAQAQYAATRDVGYGETEAEYEHGVFDPVSFNVGAALGLPVSNSGSRFDPGRGFTAGVTFRPPRSPVGLQGEYMFGFYDVEGDALEATELDGDQVMHTGALNIVVQPPAQRRFGFYLIGGGGVYFRTVEISEFAGVGVAPFCDPYFFACYPVPTTVDRVIGSQDSFDFGVNGGLGLFAMLAPPLRLYLEARYHYIWGPEFTDGEGDRLDADGEYLPVVLGLAF